LGEDATEGAAGSAPVWPTLAGPYVNFAQGALQTTGRPLDVAIDGEGFFGVRVEGEVGKFFTRAGNFSIDGEGRLVTSDGKPVLDTAENEIPLDPANGPIAIGNDGTIFQAGQRAGQLGIWRFDDPAMLVKRGNGLLQAADGVDPQRVEAPRALSGALESSNVNAIEEMIGMIELHRAFEINQKVIQSIDEVVRARIAAARE
jgi:flagellar basal body rod protein FlgG